MARKRSLPGFEDRSVPDRYCDLVLNGGVTSAVAYPGVVIGLAQAYRFQSIGGASSGSGLAALAAAAEYRRRHGSGEGFRTLLSRTAELSDTVCGRTGLSWLFQPAPPLGRLFRALVSSFAKAKPLRSAGVVVDAISAYAGSLALGFFAGLAYTASIAKIIGASEWAGWAFAAVFVGVLLAAGQAASRLLRDLQAAIDADFGLCSGHTVSPDAPHPPLTPWLHALMQDVAGLPHDQPLTFADLHAAPGGPAETLADGGAEGSESITLRVVCANVSLGRPLTLPLADDDDALFFCPREMRRLFPDAVVDAMLKGQQPAAPPAQALRPGHEAPAVPDPDEDALWRLPTTQLPVLVAVRMSVSFPVLFSAVPLWQREPGQPGFRRLLVADGGLCSNFPIHLFDRLLPSWPTFGVSLHDQDGPHSLHPAEIRRRVRLPMPGERRADRLHPLHSEEETSTLAQAVGYTTAIFDTMRNWNDGLLADLPGVRERVVEVGLPDNIGGLNILMNAEQIECLALLGGEAARQLLARYSTPDDGGQARGWREHRWIRLNLLSESIQEAVAGLTRSALSPRHAEPLDAQIDGAIDAPPLGPSRPGAAPEQPPLLPGQAAALQGLLQSLMALEQTLSPRPMPQRFPLRPLPQLRIRPPL